MRAEARGVARQDAGGLVSRDGGGGRRHGVAVPTGEEWVALPALAQQLKLPIEHVVETLLADGTRRIRFTGNRCLDIPRHLPSARESVFGETLLVAMTCPK